MYLLKHWSLGATRLLLAEISYLTKYLTSFIYFKQLNQESLKTTMTNKLGCFAVEVLSVTSGLVFLNILREILFELSIRLLLTRKPPF